MNFLSNPVLMMREAAMGAFSDWGKRHLAVIKLHCRLLLRAASRFCRLPPGRLDPLDRAMDLDQLFFAKRAETLGPIFKLICRGRYTTCLIGHDRARELLLAHEDVLPGGTIDFAACSQEVLFAA